MNQKTQQEILQNKSEEDWVDDTQNQMTHIGHPNICRRLSQEQGGESKQTQDR